MYLTKRAHHSKPNIDIPRRGPSKALRVLITPFLTEDGPRSSNYTTTCGCENCGHSVHINEVSK